MSRVNFAGRAGRTTVTVAILLCLTLPGFAQQPAPGADDGGNDAPTVESKPTKPARKPAPAKAAAPAKPAAPAKTEGSPQPELTASGKPAVTSADVRPPVFDLIDCAKAPSGAVTKLPDDLARWATVYCTKLGHIFNANDRYFGAFPDSGVRASFNSADMMGKTGDVGNDAYFTAVTYRQLSTAEADALIALDPSVKRVLVDKPLWRLELVAAGGANLSFIAIDPTAEFFWVFPLSKRGIDTPAFYVSTLTAFNKAR